MGERLTMSELENKNITFSDIAAGDNAGITYRRIESPRDDLFDELKQQPLYTLEDRNQTPAKSRGAPGIAILDYDNDSDLDVYVTNGPSAANSLYSNQLQETGEVTFIDVAEEAGVAATEQDSSGVSYGDIDNDGDDDLLVLGVGEPNRLFENQGDGTFVDITEYSGIDGGDKYSSSASMGDVNGDGLLDIVVGNSFNWDNQIPIFVEPFALNEHNQLFLNRGNNVFEDVSDRSGITNLAGFLEEETGAASITWAIAMVDYDLDGDLDIIHADDQAGIIPAELGGVDSGLIHIFNNDGTGHFVDVTVEANTSMTGSWMGLSFGDFNSDGYMDFFGSNLGEYSLLRIPGIPPNQTSRWFLGQADGTFIDPGLGNLEVTPFGWGISTLDYDNDVDTDIIFHGGLDFGPLVDASNPGTLLENDGTANFTYNANALADSTNHTQRNVQGAAVGDLNNDGFVDIVSVSNFDFPDAPLVSYEANYGSPFDETAAFVPTFIPTDNPGEFVWSGLEFPDGTLSVEINSADNGNNSLEVQTLGTVGLIEEGTVNRDGIGAVVLLTPENGSTVMQPILGGSSYASQDSLVANFGLGEQENGTIEILWPGGVRNRIYDVSAGDKLVFPEIPVSFDGDFASQQEYETLVSDAISELVAAGVLTPDEGDKFFSSAVRAFIEYQENSGKPEILFGTLENDVLNAVDSNFHGQIVFGGAGDDLLDASVDSGNNRLYGQGGNDWLFAGSGNTLIAGDGDDALFVSSGGENVFTGGNGADAFWIVTGQFPNSPNTISDLELGVDVIGVGGVGATEIADLDFNQVGEHTTISFSGVDLATVLNISASEFEENEIFIF